MIAIHERYLVCAHAQKLGGVDMYARAIDETSAIVKKPTMNRARRPHPSLEIRPDPTYIVYSWKDCLPELHWA